MLPLRDRTAWLRGDLFQCLQPAMASGQTRRLVLLGPPGVGKGTQAEMLADAFGACPLSTGDVIRAARDHSLAPGSAMANAQERMNRGELVPDDIILGLIHNRRSCLRCAAGFIFCGFPRTKAQAVALDGLLFFEHLSLDSVISYDLPFADLVARMAGRRFCSNCQARYHVVMQPPRVAEVCDRCGRLLVQRKDDRPAAIWQRLEGYAEATAQVADYYRRRGILLEVDASGRPEAVFARTMNALRTCGVTAQF